jgi:F-type H+-transporting ATPase subunit b
MESLLGILSKIGFDWQVALANLFNFLIIFFILRRYAFKPIGKLIKERQERIDQGLENAKKTEQMLLDSKKDYEEMIQKAMQESNKIMTDVKEEANKKRDEILRQTEDDINKMLEAGKKTL